MTGIMPVLSKFILLSYQQGAEAVRFLRFKGKLHNDKGAAAGCDGDAAFGDGRLEGGQRIVLAQNQLLAVEAHGSRAHAGGAGEGIDLSLAG